MPNIYDSWRSDWNGYYGNSFYTGSVRSGYSRRRSDYDTNFQLVCVSFVLDIVLLTFLFYLVIVHTMTDESEKLVFSGQNYLNVIFHVTIFLSFDYKQIRRCNTFVSKDAKTTGCKLCSYYTQSIRLNDVQLFVYIYFYFHVFFSLLYLLCVYYRMQAYVILLPLCFSSFYVCSFPLIFHTEKLDTLFV